jgi:hypothetical protein
MHCVVSCHRDILENPPKIGSTITVKHNGTFGSGLLKCPYFWRETKVADQSNLVNDNSNQALVWFYIL